MLHTFFLAAALSTEAAQIGTYGTLACADDEEGALMATTLLQADMQMHGRHEEKSAVLQHPETPEAVYQIHIPKAAGSSFAVDAQWIVQVSGRSFRGDETCFHDAQDGELVISMFRRPYDQVVSMFRYCIFRTKFDNMELVPSEVDQAVVTNMFELWLRRWVELIDDGAVPRNMTLYDEFDFGVQPAPDALNCYVPLNLQSQRLTCTDREEYPTPDEIDVDQALANMRSLWVVGLLENYDASLCLLRARATGILPTACHCDSTERVQARHGNDNSETPYPVITDEVARLLDRVTGADQVLYEAAREKFYEDVRAAEAELGVSFLCEDADAFSGA